MPDADLPINGAIEPMRSIRPRFRAWRAKRKLRKMGLVAPEWVTRPLPINVLAGGDVRRAQLVAQLIAILTRSWTPEGVVAWFSRPRRALDGRTPADVIDDPAYEQELFLAARRGRAMS